MTYLNKALRSYTIPQRAAQRRNNTNSNQVALLTIGGMSVQCRHCSAMRFAKEAESGCCLKGKVQLPARINYPERLKELLRDQTFKQNIRKYNQGLAFTSTGANVDQTLANQRAGVYTYRIQGELMHQIGLHTI